MYICKQVNIFMYIYKYIYTYIYIRINMCVILCCFSVWGSFPCHLLHFGTEISYLHAHLAFGFQLLASASLGFTCSTIACKWRANQRCWLQHLAKNKEIRDSSANMQQIANYPRLKNNKHPTKIVVELIFFVVIQQMAMDREK